jgi:hypothetical protein
MRLYIPAMDAVLIDIDTDGRLRLEPDEWITPSLQERRAVIHAAELEIAALTDLIHALDRSNVPHR